MDERKRRVLQAIIDDYIRTAEPVGSRTVARRYGLGCSPATIRNEMADLEDMGYLEQPHASAGRVPSDKGYRYYVDCLLTPPSLAEDDLENIRRALAHKARRIDDLVRQAACFLSEATHFFSLASAHVLLAPKLCALRIVLLGPTRALLILIADDGSVQSKEIDLGRSWSSEDLDRISRVLSERLAGIRFGHSPGETRALENALGRYRRLVGEVMLLLEAQSDGSDRVLVGGATNLLRQPEFRDVQKARDILDLLERESLLDDLLGTPALGGDGVGVAIGREIKLHQMQDCSLVTAHFFAPGHVAGRIGVLGPRRMDYGRVIWLVDQVARSISELLADIDAPQRTVRQRRRVRRPPWR